VRFPLLHVFLLTQASPGALESAVPIERFPTLARARLEIEQWRIDYNTQCPHSALGYVTPKMFGDQARHKVAPSARAAAALNGFAEQAPSQLVTCQHAEHMIEVN
jgi:putative transposase